MCSLYRKSKIILNICDTIKNNTPLAIKQSLKRLFLKGERSSLKREPASFKILKWLPRYTSSRVELFGKHFLLADSASFLFMYEEIFEQKIYSFECPTDSPYIVDGGANIGLSVLFFKRTFPNSKIVAFEPEPTVFDILRVNVETYQLKGVTLVQKGLWDKSGELFLGVEGADGSLIKEVVSGDSSLEEVKVKVETLLPYIEGHKVALLKLDIEGAEGRVLKSIQNNLENVDRIFIEYHSFVNQPQDIDEILAILRDQGFRMHINTPGLSSKSPFYKLNTYNGMDMQINIYAFRQ